MFSQNRCLSSISEPRNNNCEHYVKELVKTSYITKCIQQVVSCPLDNLAFRRSLQFDSSEFVVVGVYILDTWQDTLHFVAVNRVCLGHSQVN
jgi:hypothetical protein